MTFAKGVCFSYCPYPFMFIQFVCEPKRITITITVFNAFYQIPAGNTKVTVRNQSIMLCQITPRLYKSKIACKRGIPVGIIVCRVISIRAVKGHFNDVAILPFIRKFLLITRILPISLINILVP